MSDCVSQNLVIVQLRIIVGMKITILIIAIIKEKETGNKTELKESLQKNGKKKRVFILGDSILKHINGYEITKKLDNCKVYVKSFSGGKIKCMEDYAQSTIRTNSDCKVIHVLSSNDLSSKKESTEVSSAIVDLALKLKSDTFQILVSHLTTLNDLYRKNALEVNQPFMPQEEHQRY